MNVEKVLSVPNSPIEKNNPNLSEYIKELLCDKKDRNNPKQKELKVLINIII